MFSSNSAFETGLITSGLTARIRCLSAGLNLTIGGTFLLAEIAFLTHIGVNSWRIKKVKDLPATVATAMLKGAG
jgi:hypothetical protein